MVWDEQPGPIKNSYSYSVTAEAQTTQFRKWEDLNRHFSTEYTQMDN